MVKEWLSGAVAGILAAVGVAVPAQADINEVGCSFSIARPYIATVGGAQVVQTRIDASGCYTNLNSVPMEFTLRLTADDGTPEGAANADVTEYTAVRDIHNGDSLSVVFPPDDQPVTLRPGTYLACGSAATYLEGYQSVKQIDCKIAGWNVPLSIPKM
ncbi:hypothetical protein [Mycobacteroides saopaulense]|uniref:Serine/threonine protein kinase n=1 Tax=Mycobacteroides saopaulense TaxID=1578165 RepID=A0ABX3BZY4_9MYCO|nr:hypothetical protein [Mycobacteroides saopaulense]OHT83100.1 hypothetical protein BKG68_17010 [Mycobacteroides saopaulense]OHU09801.1 hypothetical protein BKG73_11675 [Mycobacteroides saopaulense]